MKRLLLTNLFSVWLIMVYAQSYQPFVIEGAHWSMSEFYNMGSTGAGCPYLQTDDCIKLEGDTIVDSVKYKKTFCSITETYYPCGDQYGQYSVNWQLIGLMREDTQARKVYFREIPAPNFPPFWCGVDSTTDSLLYDFSMGNVDSIAVRLSNGPQGCFYDSLMVDTIQIGSSYGERKEWVFTVNNYTPQADLIEGVGYSFGLFGTPQPTGSDDYDYYTRLNSYCIGPDSLCGSCYTLGVGIPNITADPKILVYPNPADNCITITTSEVIKQVTITDISGKTILSQNFNNSKITMLLTGLSKGMYICKIYLPEGEANKLIVVN